MPQLPPAPAHRYHVPTRAELVARPRALAEGFATREEVARFALPYILYDDPQLYPEVADPAVWNALQQLVGAALPTTDREFLHGPEDFASWLAELESPSAGRESVG